MKQFLIKIKVIKNDGSQYGNGQLVPMGLNLKHPLTWLLLIVATPVIFIIEGAKAVGLLWIESFESDF